MIFSFYKYDYQTSNSETPHHMSYLDGRGCLGGDFMSSKNPNLVTESCPSSKKETHESLTIYRFFSIKVIHSTRVLSELVLLYFK